MTDRNDNRRKSSGQTGNKARQSRDGGGSKLEQYRNRAAGGNDSSMTSSGVMSNTMTHNGANTNANPNLKSSQNSDRSSDSHVTNPAAYAKSNRREKGKKGKNRSNYKTNDDSYPDDSRESRDRSNYFSNQDREIIVNRNDTRQGNMILFMTHHES